MLFLAPIVALRDSSENRTALQTAAALGDAEAQLKTISHLEQRKD